MVLSVDTLAPRHYDRVVNHAANSPGVGGALPGVDGLTVITADASHANDFRTRWAGFAAVQKIKEPSWNYRLFPWDQIIAAPALYTVAALDDANGVEGFMAIRRIPSLTPPRVKIDFLATAPWNYGRGKLRSGVGPALLNFAITVSDHLGYQGALTLSSLPASESFYDQRSFRRTGQVDHEGLVVFELDPSGAQAFALANPRFNGKVSP